MFKAIAPLFAASLLCLTWTACRHSAGLPESDRAAIGRAQQDFVRFMNARDFEALANLYAEDAVILPPNLPAIQGRSAIRTHMETSPPISNFRLEPLEVAGQGDWAYTREIVTSTGVSPAGQPVSYREKVLAIWRRQPDGSWKVLRDMWNSDVPPSGS